MTIAVTGATGAVGGRVARRLAAAGADQRLVVRDAARAPDLGAEVRVASGYDAPDELRAAFEGASTLFLVPAHEALDRVQLHHDAIDAAVAAGVERIVYLSYLGASPDTTFTFGRHHWETEQLVRTSGLRWTFPRMSLYLDFIPSLAGPDGVIRGPAGNGRLAAVLRDDLADVCAQILLDDSIMHDGETYEVTGPSTFSLAEAADLLGVRYVDETVEEAYASRAGSGAPDWEVEGWVTSYLAIRNGDLDVVTDVVDRIAGHPPVSLAEYLAGQGQRLPQA
jgi:uncharacterized protein YbjT (DUF2867 family)